MTIQPYAQVQPPQPQPQQPEPIKQTDPLEQAQAEPAPIRPHARGPMRALENLLSHAPRNLMKGRGPGLDQLLKQVGVKLDRLTDDQDAALQAARVQFDFSFQAVRSIDGRTGNETLAMRVEFNASIQTLAADQDSLEARSLSFSGEMFVGRGQDPAGLFEQTFGQDTPARTIAAHAVDRYAQRVAEDEDVADTRENRQAYADLVRDAVDQAAQRVAERQDSQDLAESVRGTQEKVDELLQRFVEEGIEAAEADETAAQMATYYRRISFEMTRQRMLLTAYDPTGQAQVDEPKAEPEEVDAAA
jgi:hypothetical protein